MRRGFSFLKDSTIARSTIRAFQIAFFFLLPVMVKMSFPSSSASVRRLDQGSTPEKTLTPRQLQPRLQAAW